MSDLSTVAKKGFQSKIKTRMANSVDSDETARDKLHCFAQISTLFAQVFVLVRRAERVKINTEISVKHGSNKN